MPHPFTWVPAARQRHASCDPVPGPGRAFPAEATVTTLCGREVTTERGEIPWLWETCPGCDEQARQLAGLPSRAAIAEQAARVREGS
ncbi:zinc finger protein [Halopolyspora algeriensis]|uniref:Zinc finger protein n=1 Tax=Halopolyspora algeriensis TaxID=1500506 RepID=A0A368VWW5_9ACTN|nr:zinc finger protein [Halopolyspora algeriensis]RCW45850.1 zinc finger protein [Halopolyspora algeriensis]TQM55265.1 zinc finger protein [Halopolyspora algeriensis]